MEAIRQPEAKRFDWKTAWVAVILFSFVFRVYILLDPTKEPIYQILYNLLYVAAGTCALQCARFRADTGFRLMVPCFLWAVFSCALHVYQEREALHLSAYFLMMILAFFVCYPLAFALGQERMRRAFSAIAAAYLALIAGLCGAGVAVALSGAAIPSLAGPGYIAASMDGGRLSIFCYPTISATFCCLGLLIGLYLLARAKRLWPRVVYGLAMLVIFVALALTDSRTSGVFFSACFGGFFFLLAGMCLPIRKRILRAVAAIAVAAVAMAACYGGLRLSVRAVNAAAAAIHRPAVTQALPEPAPAVQTARLSRRPLHSAPAATAEQPDAQAGTGAADEPAAARPLLENFSTLQGRTFVWEAAVRALKNKPALLLVGSSPLFVMDAVEPYVEQLYGGEPFVHLHSIFFQTLVAFGLPGLLLFGALICYILYHALRLFFCGAGTCTLAERALPLLLFFCIAVDTMEIFLTFSDVIKHSNPWFFLTGGYVAYLSHTRIAKRGRKADDEPDPAAAQA